MNTGQRRKQLERKYSKVTDTPEQVVANRLRAAEEAGETELEQLKRRQVTNPPADGYQPEWKRNRP